MKESWQDIKHLYSNTILHCNPRLTNVMETIKSVLGTSSVEIVTDYFCNVLS